MFFTANEVNVNRTSESIEKVLKAGIKKQRMSSTTSTDDAVSTVPLSSLSLNTITEEESKKITESVTKSES